MVGPWQVPVADVAVIGTPHPKWGEQVTAVVVRRPGASLDGEMRLLGQLEVGAQLHARHVFQPQQRAIAVRANHDVFELLRLRQTVLPSGLR